MINEKYARGMKKKKRRRKMKMLMMGVVDVGFKRGTMEYSHLDAVLSSVMASCSGGGDADEDDDGTVMKR